MRLYREAGRPCTNSGQQTGTTPEFATLQLCRVMPKCPSTLNTNILCHVNKLNLLTDPPAQLYTSPVPLATSLACNTTAPHHPSGLGRRHAANRSTTSHSRHHRNRRRSRRGSRTGTRRSGRHSRTARQRSGGMLRVKLVGVGHRVGGSLDGMSDDGGSVGGRRCML